MKALKRIYNEEEAIGKTISTIAGNGEEYIIVFSDNTFLIIDVERGYEDSAGITFSSTYYDDSLLIAGGLLTAEEYEAKKAAERQAREEKEEAERKALYKKLKARYEESYE